MYSDEDDARCDCGSQYCIVELMSIFFVFIRLVPMRNLLNDFYWLANGITSFCHVNCNFCFFRSTNFILQWMFFFLLKNQSISIVQIQLNIEILHFKWILITCGKLSPAEICVCFIGLFGHRKLFSQHDALMRI